MLFRSHMEKQQGIDVVAGYVEPHARPQTAALLNGLEVLPTREVFYNGMILNEFDIGMALKRKPQLILVDELAHTNAEGCRHAKRYQDIKELLNAGIDVYTTVNVQHIESLCDTVASITEIVVRERIPDSIFDNADQVELIDIEPQDLINRLNTGNVYRQTQENQAVENFFTIENLTALREISLRRCADRVNILTENTRIKNHGDYHTGEHILVCLSSSPSNAKIIRTAAKMASAFKGEFTALFVETPDFSVMSEENVKRLRSNIRLAEQLGAKIETVYGVSHDEWELARLCGFDRQHIVYNGPMKSKETFLDAVEHGAIVNIETKRELEWLKELDDQVSDASKKFQVGIRLNINISHVSPEDADGENDNSRFGFSDETNEFADAVALIAKMPNVELAGLHIHRTAHSRSIRFYKQSIAFACKTIEKYGLKLDYLDVGGGYFGIFLNKPTYQEYSDAFFEVLTSHGLQDLCVIVEPGNALVASCFAFLSEVIDVKHVEEKLWFATTEIGRAHV